MILMKKTKGRSPIYAKTVGHLMGRHQIRIKEREVTGVGRKKTLGGGGPNQARGFS